MISVRLRLFGFNNRCSRYREQIVALPPPATVATLLDHWTSAVESGIRGEVAVERLLIIVNGRHIHHLQGLDTPLVEGDVVTLLPPVVGG